MHSQEELENSQEELEPHCTAMVLDEMRCGGTACSRGVLQWRDTGSATESGREGEDGGCPQHEGAAQMPGALPGWVSFSH